MSNKIADMIIARLHPAVANSATIYSVFGVLPEVYPGSTQGLPEVCPRFMGVLDQKVPGATIPVIAGLTRNLYARIKIAGQARNDDRVACKQGKPVMMKCGKLRYFLVLHTQIYP